MRDEKEEDYNKVSDIIKAQNGNEEIMEVLIENNRGLIWNIVRRFKDRGIEIDDLYQIGVLGFIKSVKKFDTSFDVKLSTYAVPYIMGEVKIHIRDNGPIKVSRSIRELGIKILQFKKEYSEKTGQEVNINEIAKILKISKEEIAFALDCFTPVESIYVSTSNSDDGQELIDTLSSNVDEANNIINKLSVEQLIEGLDNYEKQLIILRYYKSKTQVEVAKILKSSQVQVSRTEKQILNKMKLKLAI